MKAIISGGGTGGHIFPALSIADALVKADSTNQILFVGAKGRMEMERVPAAGYQIEGLPISGLQRKLTAKNLVLPFKIAWSYIKAGRIIRKFKPDIAIGVGGYASAPLLWCASRLGIPCLIQEQNSFAGLTNRTLAQKARKICVAYDGMEKFFPKDKIVFTGNPIRDTFAPTTEAKRAEGIKFYGLDPKKKHILIIGGSLGCRTLNESVKGWISQGCPNGDDVEILWQCGKYYKSSVDSFMVGRNLPGIIYSAFISRMDLAYACADVVISRSGASSISEICVCAKAAIFVPSPNVAEDHQTFNAMSLVNKGAARIVKDEQAREDLMTQAMSLVHDQAAIREIEQKVAPLGIMDSAERIVKQVYQIVGQEFPTKTVNYAYFIGIGGIGMSAIARYYNSRGYKVSGYDKTPSELTARLEEEGIQVHYEDNISFVPKDKIHTIVVYTPAIPAEMTELLYVQNNGYKVLKRSKMLGEISAPLRCLAVAGTHGKTTTSTLLGHIMQSSGVGCNAFLGGISKNYDTNLLLSESNFIVAEADEFDRSFLQLFPEVAVITAMDADHLDIYNDIDHVREAFRSFASQVSRTLIAKIGLPLTAKDTSAKLLTYSFDNTEADFYARNIVRDEQGHFTFDIVHPSGEIKDCRCGIPGWVNVENSIAAAAAALCAGIGENAIRDAIGSYQGVKRRFDIHFNDGKRVYIDDYAHHPEELRSAISSIRGMFPDKKLCAVFQPHLYTRTRDFASEFASALSSVDSLILLDIYPAREEAIPGVDSSIIFDRVECANKKLIVKEELMDTLRAEHPQVLITFGAGNIDRFIEPITKEFIEGKI